MYSAQRLGFHSRRVEYEVEIPRSSGHTQSRIESYEAPVHSVAEYHWSSRASFLINNASKDFPDHGPTATETFTSHRPEA